MRRAAPLPVRIAVLSLLVAGAFACAQGGSPEELGRGLGAPTKTSSPTEPPPASETVPESESEPEPESQPTAKTPDASTPATGADAGTSVDAGSDAGPKVDAGVDAGPQADAGACTKAPPSNACGVAPQCGCAANETCEVTNTTTGAVSCVLAGGGPLGSVCATTQQCAKGLTCQFGACRPYCSTPGAACGGANLGVCYAPVNGNNQTTPNLSVCAVACDPKNPATACASNTCVWFPGDQQSDCNAPGSKTKYQACGSLFDCAPGLACAFDPLQLGNACLAWCRVGMNSDCPGLFEACDDVYGANAPVVNGVKYGLCR